MKEIPDLDSYLYQLDPEVLELFSSIELSSLFCKLALYYLFLETDGVEKATRCERFVLSYMLSWGKGIQDLSILDRLALIYLFNRGKGLTNKSQLDRLVSKYIEDRGLEIECVFNQLKLTFTYLIRKKKLYLVEQLLRTYLLQKCAQARENLSEKDFLPAEDLARKQGAIFVEQNFDILFCDLRSYNTAKLLCNVYATIVFNNDVDTDDAFLRYLVGMGFWLGAAKRLEELAKPKDD
uniref:Uncharacterized protein n=1 Tax=Trimeris anceps TaxID=368681 RepID=A0A1L6BSM5_9ASTR|nr:hypothetical protein Lo_anc1Pt0560 [Lobelia anceps]APQ39012.1 hypothetical protein Lo_anc1Pt0560 [Lobelia anceps]